MNAIGQTPVEAMWNRFELATLPGTVPDVQRSEMKKAFYAGILYLLDELVLLGDQDVGEEAGAIALAGMHAECFAFFGIESQFEAQEVE